MGGNMRPNPYIVGDWVDKHHFYGREDLLRQILQQSTHIIHVLGMRRIGKTSILKRMAAEQPDMLYLNLQRTGGEWDRFQRLLQRTLKQAKLDYLHNNHRLNQAEDVCDILDILDEASADAERTLWLLLDEAELLIELGRNNLKMLKMFQGTMWETRHLKLLFASAKQMSQLDELTCTDDYGTPFLNHFPPPIFVRNLSDEAAARLIRRTQSEQPIEVPEEVVMGLCEYTDNFPFYLQWLGYRLWEDNPNPQEWQFAPDQLPQTPDLERMMRYDFDYLSSEERAIIRAVLHQEEPPAGHQRLYLHGLVRLGYLKQTKKGYVVGNRFLEAWLRRLPDQAWCTESLVSNEAMERLYERAEPAEQDGSPDEGPDSAADEDDSSRPGRPILPENQWLYQMIDTQQREGVSATELYHQLLRNEALYNQWLTIREQRQGGIFSKDARGLFRKTMRNYLLGQ